MTAPTPLKLSEGDGYATRSGLFVNAPKITLLPLQTLSAGITLGPVVELGARRTLALTCQVTAKSGTSPTLDATVQTSPDGANNWKAVSTFVQKTDVGLLMGAVTPTGTSPPTVTLTGTQLQEVDFRMECTTLGARGTAVLRYSIDGGKSYVSGVVSAATISVIDANGTDTGLVINYANATAAVDNVWTAKTIGYERKVFTGLDRFARVAALIGGSATPTMGASIVGEAC